jgi:hypothetical protein
MRAVRPLPTSNSKTCPAKAVLLKRVTATAAMPRAFIEVLHA